MKARFVYDSDEVAAIVLEAHNKTFDLPPGMEWAASKGPSTYGAVVIEAVPSVDESKPITDADDIPF